MSAGLALGIVGVVTLAILAGVWLLVRRARRAAVDLEQIKRKADVATLKTIEAVKYAQDASRSGGGDWHERLRRDSAEQ